jgi:DNA primase
VFPALDEDGGVRYLQARCLDPGDGPKYLNPAADLAANPRLAWTVPVQPPRPGILVICEGIPDALTAAQAGHQAVAVLGSHAPDAHVAVALATRARRDGSQLVAVIDNDDAGHAWGERLRRLLDEQGRPLTVIAPPTLGTDLNDWARHDPTWTAIIDARTRHPQLDVGRRRPPAPADRGIDLS